MTYATLVKLIRGYMKSLQPEYIFCWQGGEPTLNYPVLKKTVEYGKETAKNRGKEIDFVVCTNLNELAEDQYAKELNTSKVFLATSSQEGMPTSTLEAMASGCIVVGFSGIGGNDYMMGEGENQNCILIENGNYP